MIIQCPSIYTKLNQLSSVEVSKSNISTQIMFEFEEPIYFQRDINAQTHQLVLTFPGMTLHQFKGNHVTSKLARLKTLGVVNDVRVSEESKPFPRVELTLTFQKEANIADGENQTPSASKNGFLIRWSKMEDPNRLIFDIFSVESLEQIKKKNSFVLTTHNDIKKKVFLLHQELTIKNT